MNCLHGNNSIYHIYKMNKYFEINVKSHAVSAHKQFNWQKKLVALAQNILLYERHCKNNIFIHK